MQTIVPLSDFEGKSRSIIRYGDLETGGSGSDVETRVALLDPKHIVVRTILTYDEVDLLSYPFGGNCPETIGLQTLVLLSNFHGTMRSTIWYSSGI